MLPDKIVGILIFWDAQVQHSSIVRHVRTAVSPVPPTRTIMQRSNYKRVRIQFKSAKHVSCWIKNVLFRFSRNLLNEIKPIGGLTAFADSKYATILSVVSETFLRKYFSENRFHLFPFFFLFAKKIRFYYFEILFFEWERFDRYE